MQMGWKMPETVCRKVLGTTLVFAPAPVRQPRPALLEIHMVRSGKRLVLLVPARQPVEQRFVEEGVATLRGGNERGQTREDDREYLLGIQAGGDSDLFPVKRLPRCRH